MIKNVVETIDELVEENTKLKELLKECRDELKFMYDTYGQAYLKPFDDILIDKIDEVLDVAED